MKYWLLFLFCWCTAIVQAQDVELVIASGLPYPSSSAISHDNRFVATAMMNRVMLWDVKTGRLLRDVYYSDDVSKSVDSIYFAPDDKMLRVGLLATKDVFEIDLATGEAVFVKSETPMDWANYKYVKPNQLKNTIYLAGPAKEDLLFPSPDGKAELVLRKVTNPYGATGMLPKTYEIRLKIKGQLSEPLDSAYSPCFDFSDDSRYVFVQRAVYDLKSGRRVSKNRVVPSTGLGVAFVPGTHIPVTCGVGGVRIWDFPNVVDIPAEGMIEMKAAPGYRYLIAEQYDEATKNKKHVRIDLQEQTATPLRSSATTMGNLSDVAPDGNFFSWSELSKDPLKPLETIFTARIANAATGKEEHVLDGSFKTFFTPDPDYILKDSNAVLMFRYGLKNKKLEKFPTEGVTISTQFAGLSNDHQYLMGNTINLTTDNQFLQTVNLWNVETGNIEFEQEVKGAFINSLAVSKDHKYVAFASSFGHTIYVCDFKSREIIYQLKGHTGYVMRMAFSDDAKRLISGSMDGTRKVWNLEKGEEMVSLISTGKDDYAIVTPDQYYYATKGAQKSIHFVKGVKIFPFAQFDLIYNRPDIILERLLSANTDLIRPYNLAYKKRLARLGFTEEMLSGDFHLPEVEITNAVALPVTTSKRDITLEIDAKDTQFKLDRMMVRVNGVPLEGKKGISLRKKPSNTYSESVSLPLSVGANAIAVSVINEKGVESIVSQVEVEYLPATSILPTLHLVAVGVSKHQTPDYDLKYASKDAGDLSALFQQHSGLYNRVIVHQLTDDEVSRASVEKLHQELQNTSVDDVVLLFFAGHGLLDADLNYFLAAHTVDFEDLGKGGIPYETMEDLLDGIPARKKLMLLDACHSGEIDKEEVAKVKETELSYGAVAFRAVGGTGLKQVGLNNSFELMKELFADIRKSSGSMIISSAGGTEFAMEGDDWNNGVFTYCLLNGLKNGKADLNGDQKVMMSEVNQYLRQEVPKLTNGMQKPTNRAELSEVDWQLW